LIFGRFLPELVFSVGKYKYICISSRAFRIAKKSQNNPTTTQVKFSQKLPSFSFKDIFVLGNISWA